MDVRAVLQTKYSSDKRNEVVHWVGKSAKRFRHVFNLMLHDSDRNVLQMASSVVSCSVEAHPALIQPHLISLLDHLQEPNLPDAIKRNAMRLLQHTDVREELQGTLMDTCFRLIETPKEAVAIKAFSLVVLSKLAREYTDIIPELQLVIQEQLPNQTAGFAATARRVLNEFKKCTRP